MQEKSNLTSKYTKIMEKNGLICQKLIPLQPIIMQTDNLGYEGL